MGLLLVAKPENCTRCFMCEVWCSFHHEGEVSPLKSRITVKTVRVSPQQPMYIPVISEDCDLCGGDPLCVKICRECVLTYRR